MKPLEHVCQCANPLPSGRAYLKQFEACGLCNKLIRDSATVRRLKERADKPPTKRKKPRWQIVWERKLGKTGEQK